MIFPLIIKFAQSKNLLSALKCTMQRIIPIKIKIGRFGPISKIHKYFPKFASSEYLHS